MTEDQLVQQTVANYLRDSLGWQSVYAFDTEKLGVNGTLGRESEAEVILVRYLRQALERLNPDLPATAYEDADSPNYGDKRRQISGADKQRETRSLQEWCPC